LGKQLTIDVVDGRPRQHSSASHTTAHWHNRGAPDYLILGSSAELPQCGSCGDGYPQGPVLCSRCGCVHGHVAERDKRSLDVLQLSPDGSSHQPSKSCPILWSRSYFHDSRRVFNVSSYITVRISGPNHRNHIVFHWKFRATHIPYALALQMARHRAPPLA